MGEKNPVAEGMTKRRTVVLDGEITEERINQVISKILELQMESSGRINLVIDSGGGRVDYALQLCDFLSVFITAPVRGIAVGKCGSAATFVMLHCNERIGTPYSNYLIHSLAHNGISLTINETTTENIEHILRDARDTEEMILRLYMDKLTPEAWAGTRPSDEEQREFVRGLIKRGDQRFGRWLSAREAVEVGLIEKVVGGKLDIFE